MRMSSIMGIRLAGLYRLNERLEVYNAAKGYAIDYASGTYAPT